MFIAQGRRGLYTAATILIFHDHLNEKLFGIWFLLIYIQIFYQMETERGERGGNPDDRLSEAKKSSHCPKCTYSLLKHITLQ